MRSHTATTLPTAIEIRPIVSAPTAMIASTMSIVCASGCCVMVDLLCNKPALRIPRQPIGYKPDDRPCADEGLTHAARRECRCQRREEQRPIADRREDGINDPRWPCHKQSIEVVPLQKRQAAL